MVNASSVNAHGALSWTKEMLHEFARKFETAYANNEAYKADISWIFSKIRDAVIFMASDLKSDTHFGADFKNFETEDELEAWIIEFVFPKLESANWPAPGTTEFVECMHKLKVEIMNVDPAMIELKNRLSSCSL